MDRVDCVVVGAGVVGLAVARALALEGREVLVLEACNAIGTETSARNSEVIHAGIYYPAGSLKAQLCVQGKALLYDYCASRAISHRRCGKLIVATDSDQLGELHQIRNRAQRNGVDDLVLLDAAQAHALEPQLRCEAALLSPSTGIVDSHGLMLSLQADLENAGGMVALNSALARALCTPDYIDLEALDGTCLRANAVVNAAGLHAPELASRFEGLPAHHVPTAHFAKGNYFSLAGKSPFTRLIYPVPEAAGLGVHLTLDLAGQARFGPDVEWVDSPDALTVAPERSAVFYAAIRNYWPALPDHALLPAYAGIRPKISGPDEPTRDFCIQGPPDHGVRGLVNLFGIESPGLTASMAIADRVAGLINS
ncbi:MAG: NAD(P)/FAD-dependent oxidoreductase [Rhodoferax sp.]|nr:NAD(P)/FAD-dependent oxidoreductase [Rhodoferax sp.]MCF8210882.1 NAD(P)/FAD-dependent oxidoreductase [Rhodoferax sp.]